MNHSCFKALTLLCLHLPSLTHPGSDNSTFSHVVCLSFFHKILCALSHSAVMPAESSLIQYATQAHTPPKVSFNHDLHFHTIQIKSQLTKQEKTCGTP